MDWYAWMCRAGLQPDVAFQYALLFARNDLAAGDLRRLDHEFLATMGVPVAKHRLEILNLARRDKPRPSSSSSAAAVQLPWRATRLLAAAVRRSALSLADRLRSVARRDKTAVAVAPRPSPLLWKAPLAAPSSAARRGGGARKMALLRHVSKPMLTNSSGGGKKRTRPTNGAATYKAAAPAKAAIAGCFANPDTYTYSDDDDDGDGGDDMRWESMFQDLKPT